MSQKSEIFNKRMKEIFVGEDIDGDSGYINLMRIKSLYFDEKFQELNNLVEEKIGQFDNNSRFRDEIYDKLYSFVKKYFSESGSVYFSYTPLDEKVYERVYSNKEDVSMFWKTHMLYYVKTEHVWDRMEINDYNFNGEFFDIIFNIKNDNEKLEGDEKDLIFELDDFSDDTVYISVRYSEGQELMGKSRINSMRKKIKSKYSIDIANDELESLFEKFKKQNEVDYFINKNADEFLKNQFDMWMKEYVLDDDTVYDQSRLNQIKCIRDIAYELIGFVSKFEEELARIWNKPRAVRDSGYIISICKLVEYCGMDYFNSLLESDGWSDQRIEWNKLEIISEDNIEIIDSNGMIKDDYRYLPIDTKNFPNYNIVKNISDIDNKIDGVLINSENYQALNTIKQKYENMIDFIYNDPPYNTGNLSFHYDDSFNDSTWLTLLENRTRLAKRNLMSDRSTMFTSIGDSIKNDYRATSYSRFTELMNDIFGQTNYMGTIARRSGTSPRHDSEHLANEQDYVIAYAKFFENAYTNNKPINKDNYNKKDKHYEERGNYQLNKLDRGSINYSTSMDYPIEAPDGSMIYAGGSKDDWESRMNGDHGAKDWCWRWGEEHLKWGIDNDFIVFDKDRNGDWTVKYKIYEKVDNWNNKDSEGNPYGTIMDGEYNENAKSELEDLFGESVFQYAKPTGLVDRLLKIGTDEDSLVLDYFAGTGTTGEAVIQRNKVDNGDRKFILVEMGEYFDTVLIPRIKKISYSDEWENGHPDSGKGAEVFCKYYRLEQYEDILSNMSYSGDEKTLREFSDDWDEYIFMSDKKLTESVELDNENKKINIDLSNIYKDVDIPETLSYLFGKEIYEIKDDEVVFKDGSEVSTVSPPIDKIKPLIWWGDTDV